MLYHKRGKSGRNNVQHVILEAVGTRSALLPSDIARITRGIFAQKQSGTSRKTDPRYDVPRGIRRLVARGCIQIKKKNGKEMLTLTAKGENILWKIKYGNISLKKPKRWDGKWRVVIYDIEEGRKHMRWELKEALVNVGFISIQKSVWAYPYPCEDLLAMLKADFKVGKEVLYLVVDKLENDQWVKRHFKLT